MVTIKFFGRILPVGFHLHAVSPEVTWQWVEENIELVFRVYIVNSEITVECDIPFFNEQHLSEIHRRAGDLSKTCVNLAAFASGVALITMLDMVQFPDGHKLPAHKKEIIPPECNSAFSLDPDKAAEFNQVLSLVISEEPVFLALDDLIRSITSNNTRLTLTEDV